MMEHVHITASGGVIQDITSTSDVTVSVIDWDDWNADDLDFETMMEEANRLAAIIVDPSIAEPVRRHVCNDFKDMLTAIRARADRLGTDADLSPRTSVV